MNFRKRTTVVAISLMLVVLAVTASVTSQPPAYDRYEVLGTQRFDLIAGSANKAAHLAPDGSKFIHVDGFTICLYELISNNDWTRTECQDVQTREGGSEDWGEMRWSPEGRHLTLPTFRDFLIYFKDSDIRVLDTQDFNVTNLTDDQSTSSLLEGDSRSNYDFSAHWLNDTELIFLRYTPQVGEGQVAWNGPYLMLTDMAGNVTELTTIPTSEALLVYIYALAVAPDGSQIAYGVDNRDSASGQGLWSMKLEDLTHTQIVELTLADGLPFALEYSADG